MAVAIVALFAALGGTGYAAVKLPANSVGASQLKKNAVQRAKIKNNAVDGSKVLDHSLTGADLKLSTLGKVPSATAADNATHAASAAAIDKVTYKTAIASVAAASTNSATATCDPGQHAIGGGVRVDDPINGFVIDGYPEADNVAWTSRVGNSGAATMGFTAYAVCTTTTAAG